MKKYLFYTVLAVACSLASFAAIKTFADNKIEPVSGQQMIVYIQGQQSLMMVGTGGEPDVNRFLAQGWKVINIYLSNANAVPTGYAVLEKK